MMIRSCCKPRLFHAMAVLILSTLMVATAAIAATATISTNQTSFVTGDTLTLSATITAGPDAGTSSDIYIAAITSTGSMLMLDNTLTWGITVTPAVTNFSLADISAPNFYSIPNTNLPSGSYTFAIAVVRAGTDPLNPANWIAIATVIAPYTSTTQPLTFNAPAQLPPAVRNISYSYSFCGPSVTQPSDLCGGPGAPSANVSGGNPPYHFTLDTGIGFPPFGISLNLNGMLTGVPTALGLRTFGICAVDQSANQVCTTVKLTVMPSTCTGSFSGSVTDTFKSNPFCSFRHTLSGSGTVVISSTAPFAATFTATGTDVITVLPGNFPQCTGSTVPAILSGPVSVAGDGVTLTATATGGGGTGDFIGSISPNGTSVNGTLTINNFAFDAPIAGPLNLTCQ